jgi:hypothetical protein
VSHQSQANIRNFEYPANTNDFVSEGTNDRHKKSITKDALYAYFLAQNKLRLLLHVM